MTDPLYSMALLTGLMGSGHCLGMCGGVVTALALEGKGRPGGLWFQGLYNLGRLTTYAGIGLAVGWLGSAITYATAFRGMARGVLIASDLLVVLMGLSTAGVFRRLALGWGEFSGPAPLLSTSLRRLRALPPAWGALPMGLLLGFLPCGLLYTVALAAAQSASATRGALTMLAFGVGTLPALLLCGGLAHGLGFRARAWMLRTAGVMVALMGIYNLWRHWQLL